MTDFASMTSRQLVEAFNEMVDCEELASHERRPARVTRFATRDDAIRRCQILQQIINELRRPEPSASEFPARPGSNRTKAFNFLRSCNGSVPLQELVAAVYGPNAHVEDFKGPINMVLKGVTAVLQKQEMPYEIRRVKEGRTTYVGLYQTN